MQYIIIFAIVVAAIIGGPIASIVSLNTLFNLDIPITLGTWFASFWLTTLFSSSFIRTKAK